MAGIRAADWGGLNTRRIIDAIPADVKTSMAR